MNVLITGGCGFIGCNVAARLRELGHQVCVFDDLSRAGAKDNLAWLRAAGLVEFVRGDVRDVKQLAEVFVRGRFHAVIHLAAQVAVTTSVQDPRHDFEVNALGTLNVLEAIRVYGPETVLLNASTNKVYGTLHDSRVTEGPRRYELPDLPYGVAESQPLDFHSPYGCSKGAADQYVVDYGRIYGLRTVNFRQSCIYGYRQFGVEDQGWVAWFTVAHLLGRVVTIYGTGKQVRDLLFIDDLVDLYVKAIEGIDRLMGVTFNVGGGAANALSLLEFLEMLGAVSGRPVEHRFADWRPGDQPVYVSDVRRVATALGWKPQVGAADGIGRLYGWVANNLGLFASLSG